MTFRPAIWYPISIVLSGLNLVGVGFAAGEAQALARGRSCSARPGVRAMVAAHATGSCAGEFPVQQEALEAIEAEVSRLREDLSETQERLDFTERLVVQGQEARRVGSER